MHELLCVVLFCSLPVWKPFPPIAMDQIRVPVFESAARIPVDFRGTCVVLDKSTGEICVREYTPENPHYDWAVCCRPYAYDLEYRVQSAVSREAMAYHYVTSVFWKPDKSGMLEMLCLEAYPAGEVRYLPETQPVNRKHERDTAEWQSRLNQLQPPVSVSTFNADFSRGYRWVYKSELREVPHSGDVVLEYDSPLLPGPGTYEYKPLSDSWTHPEPTVPLPPEMADKPYMECDYVHSRDMAAIFPVWATGYTACPLYDPAWPPTQLAGRLLKDLPKFAETGWVETQESVPASVTDLLRQLAEETAKAGTLPTVSSQAFDQALDDIRAAFDQNRLAAEARDILTLNLQHLKAATTGG